MVKSSVIKVFEKESQAMRKEGKKMVRVESGHSEQLIGVLARVYVGEDKVLELTDPRELEKAKEKAKRK